MDTSLVHFIHCLTPLHTGSGTGLGSLDRPLLREATTGYPIVQGSTLKGILRATAVDAAGKPPRELLDAAFGRESLKTKDDESGGSQGCVAFGDAFLALLPVRSLAGTFAWVTSPLVLARLERLLERASPGKPLHNAVTAMLSDVQAPDSGRALGTTADAPLRLAGTPRYGLEGLVLTPVDNEEDRKRCLTLAHELGSAFLSQGFWWSWFEARLLVIHDQDYAHLVEHATEVAPNIQIGPDGTTKAGSLRFTEYLPTESVLAGLLHLARPFGESATLAPKVEGLIRDLAGGWQSGTPTSPEAASLQVGADETKGKGLVRSFLFPAQHRPTTATPAQGPAQGPAEGPAEDSHVF